MSKEDSYTKLGKLTYQMGKQQEVVRKETDKLQAIQQKMNEVATEIEQCQKK